MSHIIKASRTVAFGLLATCLFATFLLISPQAKAESSESFDFNVTVPSFCTIRTSNNNLSQTITAGLPTTIGIADLNATCNDPNGFAIYAVGYTNEQYGNNVLSTELTTQEHNYDIATGTATSGNTSTWSMTISNNNNVVGTNYEATIENGFGSAHVIPNAYTKVASRTAHTDQTTGTNLNVQFDVYAALAQPASTYTGTVKFTLVHPSTHAVPETPIAVPGQICYYGNGADEGSMACQTTIDINNSATALSANAEVQLRASNFQRAGYGFTGWNTKEDGTGTQYGPMETITFTSDMYTNGLVLFANWKAAETNVTMQTFNPSASPYSTMTNGSVIALKDTRDNDVYAVAKLADGNWWMIENLRLDYDANITTSNTQSNNGSFGGVFAGLPEPETANFSDSTTPNSLYTTDTTSTDLRVITGSNQGYRFPRYNNNNTASPIANNTTSNTNVYSYGNYYTWAAAIADTTAYSTGNQSVSNTSLCPSGWHLPKGGNKSNEANNEWWNLTVNGIMNNTNPANYESSTYPYYTGTPEGSDASKAIRAYPNNLVYSGNYSSSSAGNRGTSGLYWSSTVDDSSLAYYEFFSSTLVCPGTFRSNKYNGLTVRCLTDASSSSNSSENGQSNSSNNEPSSSSNNPANPSTTNNNMGKSYTALNNTQSTSGAEQDDKDKTDDTNSTNAATTNTEPLGVRKSGEGTVYTVEGNDTSNAFGVVAIAGAAALGAAGLIIIAGKRRKDDDEEEQ